MKKGKVRGSCETCTFYIYDEEYEAYLCDMNMDEENQDEYAVVRKQM